ncbi:unnamed protein product, partial [Ectocarpus sp. 13 AM-2016]
LAVHSRPAPASHVSVLPCGLWGKIRCTHYHPRESSLWRLPKKWYLLCEVCVERSSVRVKGEERENLGISSKRTTRKERKCSSLGTASPHPLCRARSGTASSSSRRAPIAEAGSLSTH